MVLQKPNIIIDRQAIQHIKISNPLGISPSLAQVQQVVEPQLSHPQQWSGSPYPGIHQEVCNRAKLGSSRMPLKDLPFLLSIRKAHAQTAHFYNTHHTGCKIS